MKLVELGVIRCDKSGKIVSNPDQLKDFINEIIKNRQSDIIIQTIETVNKKEDSIFLFKKIE